MKRILAAIDFSPVSEPVIEHAAAIARAFSAKLTLLHVAAPDPDHSSFGSGPQSVRDRRANELRDEHRRLHDRAQALEQSGIDASALLIQGPAVETIVARAGELSADLIVIGSHGHGALYRALLGSVSEGVLHKAGRPVMVVPARP